MRKITVNSIENKYHYLPGDYVIEANFSEHQFNELFKMLYSETHIKNTIDGFEFSIDKFDKTINALSIYGRKSSDYIKRLNGLIHNSYKLNTKVYCIA